MPKWITARLPKKPHDTQEPTAAGTAGVQAMSCCLRVGQGIRRGISLLPHHEAFGSPVTGANANGNQGYPRWHGLPGACLQGAAAWFGGFCFLFQCFFPAELGEGRGATHVFSTCSILVFSSLENRGFGSVFSFFLFFKCREGGLWGFYPRLRLSLPFWLLWLPEAATHTHLRSVAPLTEFI